MIYLYSGTPGSGKSYHSVADIFYRLKKKKGFSKVIANFPIKTPYGQENFVYMDNPELTTDNLKKYALKNHKIGIEGQTLVVIDEAQIIFNSRSWNGDGSGRMEWIKFFSQHRKLGFNFILIAQFDRMLDRQIRCLIEYEVAHMKVNNYFRLIPLTTFLVVTRWYGQRMKLNHDLMIYRKKIAKLYDTFALFDKQSPLEHGEQGDPIVTAGEALEEDLPCDIKLDNKENLLKVDVVDSDRERESV